jgi:hypothetical protein
MLIRYMQVRYKQNNIPAKPTEAASRQVPLLSLPHAWLPAVQLGGRDCIIGAQNLKPPMVDTWHSSVPGHLPAAVGAAAAAAGEALPAVAGVALGLPATAPPPLPATTLPLPLWPPIAAVAGSGAAGDAPAAPALEGAALGVTALAAGALLAPAPAPAAESSTEPALLPAGPVCAADETPLLAGMTTDALSIAGAAPPQPKAIQAANPIPMRNRFISYPFFQRTVESEPRGLAQLHESCQLLRAPTSYTSRQLTYRAVKMWPRMLRVRNTISDWS